MNACWVLLFSWAFVKFDLRIKEKNIMVKK